MFYLIINKNNKEILSNQIGMQVLYPILIDYTKSIKQLIISSFEKELLTDFCKESILLFQTQNIQINLKNRKYIELKDLTIPNSFVSSLSCFYLSFLKLLEDWEKFKNDDWKQFVILFNGEIFSLIPIYNDNSLYVENLIKENKNKSYLISFYDTIGNTTFEHVTINDPEIYLICYLFGESTFLFYLLDEIKEFAKPSSDYGIGHERISINSLKNDLIEIIDSSEEFDHKIILTKENFLNIVKKWHDLQYEFGIYDTHDLKKIMLTYFNNEISFEYELDPQLITKLAKKKAERNENSL